MRSSSSKRMLFSLGTLRCGQNVAKMPCKSVIHGIFATSVTFVIETRQWQVVDPVAVKSVSDGLRSKRYSQK